MNSAVLIVMIMEVACAFGWLLITCELGERFTAKFNEISLFIDQFKWYSFPFQMQRMLPTIAVYAQQPITPEVFGSLTCSRDSYKKVSGKLAVEIISHTYIIGCLLLGSQYCILVLHGSPRIQRLKYF